MPAALKPYLRYSAALHLLLALIGWKMLHAKGLPATPVYTIDFVGPTTVVDSAASASSSPAAPSAPRAAASDELVIKRRRNAPLPKPSLLTGYREPEVPEKAAPEPPAENATPGSGAATSQPPGAPEAGIATDMPNFPYPWYISQVRAALWAQWSSRLPQNRGEATVMFSILPSGQMTDRRVESSSGDSAFDLAALSAVQDAAPFPPLPRGFSEPFLKIHLTLRR